MPVYQTDGIILKKKNFSEADRLLTIFTKKKGKITAIAKGARRPISRKGGNLDILNWCNLQLAIGTNFDIVVEVQVKRSYNSLKSDLKKTSLSFVLCEALDSLASPNQPLPDIYSEALNTLKALSITHNNNQARIILIHFQLKILTLLGYFSINEVSKHLLYPDLLSLTKPSLSNVTNLNTNKLRIEELENYVTNYLEQVIERKLQSAKFSKNIPQSLNL